MSTYRQRIDRLGRRHLAFNPRFAAVTVGSCGDSWKLRRVAGKASNMTENALSILIIVFSAHLQQTEISERKAVYFPPWASGTTLQIGLDKQSATTLLLPLIYWI